MNLKTDEIVWVCRFDVGDTGGLSCDVWPTAFKAKKDIKDYWEMSFGNFDFIEGKKITGSMFRGCTFHKTREECVTYYNGKVEAAIQEQVNESKYRLKRAEELKHYVYIDGKAPQGKKAIKQKSDIKI